MIHIVVVGHAYRGNVTREIADRPSKDEPFALEIEHRRFDEVRRPVFKGSEPTYRFVDLVPRPQQDVGLVVFQMRRKVIVRKSKVPETGEQADNNILSIARVPANRTAVRIFR